MKTPFDEAMRLTVRKMTAMELLDLINELAAKDIESGGPIEGAHYRALCQIQDALKDD